MKKSGVMVLSAHKPWIRVTAEIEKCDVRCANDHRRKTARDFGYARWLAQNEVKWHDARE